ncbi:NTP transferase domain-containing protein [Cohnella sp. CFH 77786]|uniref:nucleotidyltransferase family protein n=1 Tax=Cohnella sp. CFH 77786 TaxID=2662265 RepID=UPI001C60D236|nr:NTP transferase domain-containing protein [Cohnella sp. CFH 77786]
MGGNKPSAELAAGNPLGRAALEELLKTELDPIVAAVRPGDALEWLPPDAVSQSRFRVAVCPDADEGLSRSLRCALAEALRLAPDIRAAIVALADQPMVTLSEFRLYLEAFAGNPLLDAVAGSNDGQPVPPVLWNRSMFGDLSALEGDSGGRNLLRRDGIRRALIPLGRYAVMDVDTPEDFAKVREKWAAFSRSKRFRASENLSN